MSNVYEASCMFDLNPPHTFDKIVKKLITTKKCSQSLTLSPNVMDYSRNQKLMTWVTKHMPPKKKFEQRVLSNWCDAGADLTLSPKVKVIAKSKR